jgi:thiopeptide-type bacteriocin biosynthesis protein
MLVPSGFVVLRVPALPFALGADAVAERADDPWVTEAIWLASPALGAAIGNLADRPPATEAALVRYLIRMATRPTPFGLLAGWSTGTIGSRTRLELGDPTASRRISLSLVDTLLRHLNATPHRAQSYRVNPGIHRAADRWHVPQSLGSVEGYRGDVLSIELAPPVERLLRVREEGRPEVWARRLRQAAPALSPPGSRRAISALIEAEVLVPAGVVAVTAGEPIEDALRSLSDRPGTGPIRRTLRQAQATLGELNRGGRPGTGSAYRRLTDRLTRLPGCAAVRSPFDADLARAGEIVVRREVVTEITRAIEWLHRWNAAAPVDPLEPFRRAFRDRYGDREIPLLEALDEEVGIGLPVAPPPVGAPDRRRAVLLERLVEVWRQRGTRLVLDPTLGGDSAGGATPPLPRALSVIGSFAARSGAAIDQGEYWFRMVTARGPSGGELLGRLAAADDRLAALLPDHLGAEAVGPATILAEVVHSPAARLTAVQRRPGLRDYEIVITGRPSVPPSRQVHLADLRVAVPADLGRVQLRSARLRKWVEPRLTTAHDVARDPYPPYRFLGLVHRQGVAERIQWDWGDLDGAPFLPRVELGRVVLARARWRISAVEAAGWSGLAGAARTSAVAQWRRRRQVPRYVQLPEPEGELTLDLTDRAGVDRLTAAVGRGEPVVIEEMFPKPAELPVRGPGGRFAHDLIIPLRYQPNARAARAAPVLPRPPAQFSPEPVRTFIPGSEWLSVKWYGGPRSIDRVLRERLGTLADDLGSAGIIDRWFFIRFRDPERHLRIRFHGPPARLAKEAIPIVAEVADSLHRTGLIHRVEFDCYQPEVERFGGTAALALIHSWFHGESAAVVRWLGSDAGEAPDGRLPAAARAVNRLLVEWGIPLDRRGDLVDGVARRVALGDDQRSAALRDVGARIRGPGPRLGSAGRPGPFRIEDGPRLAAEVRELARTGQLTVPVDSLIADLVHLRINRLLAGIAPIEEPVVLWWLGKLYRGRLARRAR